MSARDHLITIGVRLFQHALSPAARLGHDAVGIRLSFILDSLFVFPRFNHVIKRSLHLRRRLGFVNVDRRDTNTRGVVVEILLQTTAHIEGDRSTALSQSQIHGRAAHNVTQRTLCRVLQ